MNCLNREILFSLAQGLLEGREADEARAHVDECAACCQVVAQYRQLESVLDEWKPAGPSAWFDIRVRQAVANSQATPSKPGLLGLSWTRWVVWASLVAVVSVAAVVYRRAPKTSGISQPAPVKTEAEASTSKLQTAARPQPTVSTQASPAHEAKREAAPMTASQFASSEKAGAQLALAPSLQGMAADEDTRAFDDYDLLANFDVLSELPQGARKIVN